ACARKVFQQHVTVRDECREHEANDVVFAHDRLIDVRDELLERVCEPGGLLLSYRHCMVPFLRGVENVISSSARRRAWCEPPRCRPRQARSTWTYLSGCTSTPSRR